MSLYKFWYCTYNMTHSLIPHTHFSLSIAQEEKNAKVPEVLLVLIRPGRDGIIALRDCWSLGNNMYIDLQLNLESFLIILG